MRILLAPLLGIALISSSNFIFLATAQDASPPKGESFPIPPNIVRMSSFSAWDDSRNQLILETYDKQDHSAPVIKIFNVVSGEIRFIHLSQQFPNLRSIDLEALAPAPGGSVLLACEIDADLPSYLGDHLLLYDEHSALLTDITAADYDIAAVAADSSGNIYALGTHETEDSNLESYPLIQKYDSHGHLVAGMLTRSLFPEEDDPTGNGHPLHNGHDTGTPLLTATTNGVRVYLPKVGELLAINDAGQIRNRVHAIALLSGFAQSHGFAAFDVDGNAFSPSGDLWLAGRLENPSNDPKNSPPARDFLVRITAEGKLESPYEETLANAPPNFWPQLIGFTASNQPVVWDESPTGNTLHKAPY